MKLPKNMKFPKNRCQISTKNGRKCHAPACCTMGGKNMCILHEMHIYRGSALIIQNAFCNYKMRKAINIFKKLPKDLQHKIQFNMRENMLIKKHHHNVIEQIIFDKLEALAIQESYTFEESDHYDRNCMNMFKLITKYSSILKYGIHVRFASTILQPLNHKFPRRHSHHPDMIRPSSILLKERWIEFIKFVKTNSELWEIYRYYINYPVYT